MLHLLSVIFGVLLGGTVLGLVAFSSWVLGTPSGARWVVGFVDQADWGVELHVDEIQGRLLGPLGVRGLVLKLPTTEVRATQASLVWSPAQLLWRRVAVDMLVVQDLHVSVLASDAPQAPASPPKIPHLPVSIAVGSVRIDRLKLQLPGVADVQVIEAIAADRYSWQGEHMTLDRIAARHAQTGPVELGFDARLENRQIEILSLRVRADATDPPARLKASGLLHLDDTPSTLDLAWSTLRWPLGGDPVVSSREGHLKLAGSLQDFSAQGAFALGDTAQIQTQARYSKASLDAKLAWTQLAWPLIGPARVQSAQGRAEVSGTPEAYRYTLDAQLAAEGKKGTAQAQGSGGLDHVVLEALNLAVGPSAIAGKAQVIWRPALDVTADLSLKNLDPALVDPAWPGQLNGTLVARTRLAETGVPQIEFVVGLDRSRLRGYPFALDAKGRAEGARVDLDVLKLVSGATRLDGRGRVTPPFDLSATLASTDLASLWPGLAGKLNLDASVKGPLQTPHVTARGNASGLGLDALRLGSLVLDADVDLSGAWSLNVEANTLSGPATVEQIRVQLDGNAGDHVLKLAAKARPASLDLEARGAFDRAHLSWNGVIAAGRLAPSGPTAWTLETPAALRADRQQVQLEPACWTAASSRVCAQALRDGTQVRSAFRLERLDFAYFASFMPTGWSAQGGIDGTGGVELRDGALSEAHADLATQPASIAREGETLFNSEAGHIRIDQSGGRAVADMKLPLREGSIRFHGELGPAADPLQRPLSALLDVALSELGVLRLASEDIERLSGRLDGRMTWTGTAGAPQAVGDIHLSGGVLRLATPGIELTEVTARVGADASGAMRVTASATSGGGRIDISGQARVNGDSQSADLAIKGENFQAANTTEARAWISPDLQLKFADRRLELRGDLNVPRAEITPVSFDSGVGPSGDQVIVTGEEDSAAGGGLKFIADVLVVLGDKVSVDGFGLKTHLAGSVRAIEQTGRAGSGRGEVRLEGGRYKAYGQDLEIESGRLLFNGGPLTEPAIEIRALRKPREDIEVGVFVRGTLDKPEFQLYSTPSMPRERQLSWLVLGRSLEDTGTGDDKALLANAALSLGLSGTDFLAQNLRGGLGLDEVSIGAEGGEDAQQAKFTVGKYLSPRLYVSYGVGLFQPAHVFKLLYDLGRGFKVSTESGVHTGGDLLYSVERP
ncbi:MAG: translocation/assembly module TamB domain-containing protein [Panacagrimonas sp.]